MKRYLLILVGFLWGCQQNPNPHFVEVSSKQLEKWFEPGNGDFIDTLIRAKDYEFYYLADMHHWEGDNFYFLRRGDKLFKLEPEEIGNGFKTVWVVNDSTLLFYTQFYNRPFGDFWIIKRGTETELRLDSGIIYNTDRYNLKYKRGKLVAIGDNEVLIDSTTQKQLRNTLYRLEQGELVSVSRYDVLKDDIENLEDGIYYFSFPGRHISDTLILTR